MELNRKTYFFSAWIIPKGIALIYLMAFLSLWWQLHGLVGSEGILPFQDFLEGIKNWHGSKGYFLNPTVFWFFQDDRALHVVSGLGVVFSLTLLIGIFPKFSAIVNWVLYLSLVNISQEFLRYQWDVLLLEAGFLAILLAPTYTNLIGFNERYFSIPLKFLFSWLLFRLMLGSGLSKILSGDSSWPQLLALNYHFETQPIPHFISWYVHRFPDVLLQAGVVLTLIVELLIPFFIFGNYRFKRVAFFAFTFFQFLIILTGNFAFFNYLAIVLGFVLLDDQLIEKWLPLKFNSLSLEFQLFNRAGEKIKKFLWIVVLSYSVVVGGIYLGKLYHYLPRFLNPLLTFNQSFHLINSYGLFAYMTKHRDEILIEGSDDGVNWKSYEFKYKPDLVDEMPKLVAPHQPRLDWQMWFAALNTQKPPRWFYAFLDSLLENRKDAITLLEKNPFENKAPRYIRSTLWRYRYSPDHANQMWWEKYNERKYTDTFQNKLALE